jgi:hypothetical protein
MKRLFREFRGKRKEHRMRALRLSLQVAVFIMLFIFLACTSTKFSALWKDKAYQEHPKKILVINAFPNPTNRRLFEDEFVNALKDRRVDAVVSYTVMPDPIVSDKDARADEEAFWRCLQEVGADTVLINKPLGKSESIAIGAGAAQYLDVYINTQTDVYDIKSNRLVLSATAETWIQQDTPYATLIKSYIKDLVHKLSQQGLF